MATTKTAAKAATKSISGSEKKLVERLREIEQCAKHAADPREPAAQLAAALADHLEGK